jgi:hypothetical protein
MSMSDVVRESCPHCGYGQQFSIWGSVTASKDHQLKQKVRDGTIFKQTCQKCRQAFILNHSLLYNDTDSNFAVWLCDGGVTAELEDAMDSFGMVLSKSTRLRIVYTLEELTEKIRIFEADLNDIYVQTIKMGGLGEGSPFEANRLKFVEIKNQGSGQYSFGFAISPPYGSHKFLSMSNIDNVLYYCDKWDALETKFDWLYVDDNNFYKLFTQFKDYLD